MSRRARASRAGRSDDRGVVLMLFALLLTFLLILVAMAIDLGQARFDRRDEQAASDLAALDAGYFLAGKATPGVSEPARACQAAARSVTRNISSMSGLTTASIVAKCAVLPATSATCNPASPTNVTFPTGSYVLTIRYPIPTTELDTARFSGGGVADGTDACRRMRVTLAKTQSTRFATVIGIDELDTEATAVVKASVSNTSLQAPAFLVLERTDCGSLGNSANGAGNLGIIVEANGADPGVIHSDSDATTNCSGSTDDAYAIYGSPLSNGTPSITASNGSTGAPGIIESRATNGRGGAAFPGGLSVAPSTGGILSRKIMDTKYNSGSSTAITSLHSTASTAVRSTGTPAGHTIMGCSGPVPLLATKVYVDCDKVNATIVFAGVTSVVFRNKVELKQGNELRFPNATSIVVRDELALPQGRFEAPLVRDLFVGDGVKVDSGSALAVNTTSANSCAGRVPPAIWPTTTRMAVFGGSPAFESSGAAALCQTTLYLAGPKTLTSYAAQQVTSGGTCSTQLPCPRTSGNAADDAHLKVGGTLILVAPNQHTTSSPATQGLEDLALWAEGDGKSEIKSGGEIRGNGVFFFPNGTLEMRSPATGTPRDAQFFARKAFLYQGTLRLKPDKVNSVTVPIAGNFGLIR